MIAVCDMGPLHYLVLMGCDHILPRIFQRVVTARVVVERDDGRSSDSRALRRGDSGRPSRTARTGRAPPAGPRR